MHVTIDFIKQTVAHKNLSKNHIPMSAETPLFPRLCSSHCFGVLHVCDRTVTETLGAVEWGCVNMCQWIL